MLNKLSFNLANSLNESETEICEIKKTILIESDGVKTKEVLNEEGNGITYLDKLINGEEVYFRNVDGLALLVKYADSYPEPEDYDEGYTTGWERGADEEFDKVQDEKFAAAKEASENREVWEVLEIDETTLEPNGTTYGYLYGEEELIDFLKQVRQVNVRKSLEESDTNINDMTLDEMTREYAEMCEDADLDAYEILDNLIKYDVLNTGSFRNMLQELRDYLEDNY